MDFGFKYHEVWFSPVEAFEKKSVPWTPISCQCSSRAITPEAHSGIAGIVVTTSFRLTFSLSRSVGFLNSQRNQFD
jgi:hypothetical protein